MAERMVEDLLRDSFPFVQKHSHTWIIPSNPDVEFVNRKPDFTVRSKDGLDELVEVKFRKTGRFHPDDEKRLELLRGKWCPKIVLVSYVSPYFQIVRPDYIHNRGYPTTAYPIEQEREWRIKIPKLEYCIKLLKEIQKVLP
jgi:hypothetical protein